MTQREIEANPVSGYLMLLVALGVALLSLLLFVSGRPPIAIPGFLISAFIAAGLFLVNPNEAKVLQLFGRYVGTAKAPGLRWANPLYTKRPSRWLIPASCTASGIRHG